MVILLQLYMDINPNQHYLSTTEMLEAFKKGYKQAEEAWGGEVPEISQKTYDAVLEKFDAWKKEAAEAES